METNKPTIQKVLDLAIDGLMSVSTLTQHGTSRAALLDVIGRLGKIQGNERRAAQKLGKEAQVGDAPVS